MNATHQGHGLSEKELKILRFVCAGYSAKEIARLVHLEPKTIELYKVRIKNKFLPNQGAGQTKETLGMLAERQGLLAGVIPRGTEATTTKEPS
jgi:DNA-binding NarL/FixJ family response regulator